MRTSTRLLYRWCIHTVLYIPILILKRITKLDEKNMRVVHFTNTNHECFEDTKSAEFLKSCLSSKCMSINCEGIHFMVKLVNYAKN